MIPSSSEQQRAGRNRCSSGFTLIEVLIAVAITSLVLMAVYGVFASVDGARRRLTDDSEAYHRARVIFDRIGREVRGAYLKPDSLDTYLEGGGGDRREPYLALTTTATTPQGAGGGLSQVRYEWLEDAENAKETLVLTRRESGTRQPEESGREGYRLAVGIEEVWLRFHDGTDWKDDWDSRGQGPPKRVEIAMRIRSGGLVIPFRSSFELPVIGGRR
ncbi:MAG: prepilin-type N-terminal cleavage/methylation domain-containing protein [Trichloromonas sp.]|nr:prepilin-type N-terminal cleavage/methylation domain-containing protein [Trichloromonas sp.]